MELRIFEMETTSEEIDIYDHPSEMDNLVARLSGKTSSSVTIFSTSTGVTIFYKDLSAAAYNGPGFVGVALILGMIFAHNYAWMVFIIIIMIL